MKDIENHSHSNSFSGLKSYEKEEKNKEDIRKI